MDPATGRYVESDPLGLRGGSNSTYDYVRGSPVTSSDPLGLLVRGNGWSGPQWRDIQNAENKIRNELRRSCSCHKNSSDDSCIPCELVDVLLSRLDTVTVGYAPLAGNCGFTPPGQSAGLFLSEVAWDKGRCPRCLTINLFHELLHTTGLQDDPGPAPLGPVYDLERGCMNNLCRGR